MAPDFARRNGRVRALAAAMLVLLPWCQAQAGPAGADGNDFIYVVEAGDTLMSVAQRYTGQTRYWRELQARNRVADPYRLPVGMRLHIPLSRIPVTAGSARVVSVVGQARVDGEPLRHGASVTESSWLETGPDGMVTFELADGSRIAMPPGTRLQVSRLRAFAGTGLSDTVLRAERGGMESAVAPDGRGVGRFEIRTPMMVTGVRGTRFEVDLGSPGQRVGRTGVQEGVVALRTKTRATTAVKAGYGAAVGEDGKASLRKLLPPPDMTRVPGEPVYADHVQVGWQPVAGATGYRVLVSRDAERTEAVFRATVSAPTARLAGLPDGKLWLAVSAVDTAGLAGQPAVSELEIRLNPPAPFGIEPAPRSTQYGDAIALRWAEVEAARAYDYALAADEDFTRDVIAARTTDNAAGHTVAPGQWWWRVRSVDGQGRHGPWSAPMAFRLMPQPPVVAPSEDHGGPLTLHWGNAGDADGPYAAAGYRVQVAADAGFAAPLHDVRVEGNEVTLPRPPAGTYYIRVARIERDGSVSPFAPAQRIQLHEMLRDSTGNAIGAGDGRVYRGG